MIGIQLFMVDDLCLKLLEIFCVIAGKVVEVFWKKGLGVSL